MKSFGYFFFFIFSTLALSLFGFSNQALASGSNDIEFDVLGGLALGSGSGTGFGGGLNVLFPAEKDFSLGGSGSFYNFDSGTSASYNYGYGTSTAGASSNTKSFEGLFSGKLKFHLESNKKLTPFVMGGVGASYLTANATASATASSGGVTVGQTITINSSTVDPLIALGGGIEMPLGSNMDFFALIRMSLLINVSGASANLSGSSSYGGAISGTTNVAGGGTFSYFPLEVGLRL